MGAARARHDGDIGSEAPRRSRLRAREETLDIEPCVYFFILMMKR